MSGIGCQLRRSANVTAQCGNDNLRIFARHLDRHGKARVTFHQSLRWTATGLLEAEEFDRLARVREPVTERE